MFNLLNLQPNKVSKDLSSYTNFIYGTPKSGKSTLAYKLFGQDGLFLGFEDGTRALSGVISIPVATWEDLTRDKKYTDEETGEIKKSPSINKQLKNEQVKNKFKVLILDTVDLMYDAAIKYIVKQEGVDDILDIPFGKGLKMADDMFKEQLLEWERLGYKLFFISHSEDKKIEIKDHKGVVREASKFIPTLNKRAFKIVSKMVDNIMFGYVKLQEDGTEKRVVFTRETNNYFAGSRFKHLADELPMDADLIKNAISNAIEKEDLTTEDKTFSGLQLKENEQHESFEEIKKNLTDLVISKFKDNMTIVSEITEKQLGKGSKITGATPEQVDALDAILEHLNGKVKELNL